MKIYSDEDEIIIQKHLNDGGISIESFMAGVNLMRAEAEEWKKKAFHESQQRYVDQKNAIEHQRHKKWAEEKLDVAIKYIKSTDCDYEHTYLHGQSIHRSHSNNCRKCRAIDRLC